MFYPPSPALSFSLHDQFLTRIHFQPWLDNKHTIFGRAVQGLDVIHRIESVKTYKEKPAEDIKILNIDIA